MKSLIQKFYPVGLSSKILQLVALLSVIGIFSACNVFDQDEVNTDYSQLSLPVPSDHALTKIGVDEFSSYIKNGIRIRLRDNNAIYPLANLDNSGVYRAQFSATNVHEVGVDEDDRIKHLNNYLFLVESTNFPHHSLKDLPGIRVMQVDPVNATASQVAYIENSNENIQTSGIYLYEKDSQSLLVSLAATRFINWNAFLREEDWVWGSGKTEVKLFDVNSPENPSLNWTIELEGNLQGSRMINNKLYLITHFIPNIPTLNMQAKTRLEKVSNEKLIQQIPLSDLLPHYQVNNSAVRTLVNPEDCLVSNQTLGRTGFANIVTLVEVDVLTKQINSTACLNTEISGIYSSQQNLYIGTGNAISNISRINGTNLHKFKLASKGVEYAASGWVPGNLGWTDPAFRMNEYQDYLRIVTTYWADNLRHHQLFILKESANRQLEEVVRLPNALAPSPIGKPGEDIFAVRFVEDRGYVVTFEQSDPLYLIDLSDINNPQMLAAMEIPGFARYLHPIADNWLLGIGHQVNNGVVGGIKIELYDLRNAENPIVVGTQVVGGRGSWSESLEDLRSISVLALDNDRKQIALPINRYERTEQGGSSWQDSGLYIFELAGLSTNNLTITLQKTMLIEQQGPQKNYPSLFGGGRSKLNADAVYYFQGNEIWGVSQSENLGVNGPF